MAEDTEQLDRIEDKLDTLVLEFHTVKVYQQTHRDKLEDHETRIRKNENIFAKVAAWSSGIALLVSATVVSAVNKLLENI